MYEARESGCWMMDNLEGICSEEGAFLYEGCTDLEDHEKPEEHATRLHHDFASLRVAEVWL